MITDYFNKLLRSILLPQFWFRVALCIVLSFGSACNPANFFNQTPVQDVTHYRKVNFKCTGLHLASSTIDVKTFRGMVDCFSPSGELGPIQTLVKDLTDADLQPIVNAANKYFLGDRQALYKMEKSLLSLSDAGLLDQSLKGFGTLLRKDLVSSSIALMKQGYSNGSSSFFRNTQGVAPEEDFLKALELIAAQISPDVIDEVLKQGLSTVGARAFQDLQKQVRKQSSSRHTFQQVIQGLHHFLEAEHTVACGATQVEIRRDLLLALRNGGSTSLLNAILGGNASEVQTKLPRILYLLEQTLAASSVPQSSSLLSKMSAAIGQLNQPIVCPGANVPNGARHLIRKFVALPTNQLRTYVLEDGVKELVLLKPMCELPPLDAHYRSLMQLADQGAIEPMAEMLKVLDRVELPWPGCTGQGSNERYHPWTTFLTNVLGDVNFQDFLPAVESLKDLDVFPELMLLAALPGEQAQQNLDSFLQFMIRPMPELGHRSIYELMSHVAARASFTQLFNFGSAVRALVMDPQFEQDPEFWTRILTDLRNGMYINNVHPMIDLVKRSMGEATQNAELYDTLFKISDRPSFLDSIELLSNMAKSGELKQLLLASLELFHTFAEQAQAEVVIEARTTPMFVASRKHNWARTDLLDSGLSAVLSKNTEKAEHCRQLDLDFSFIDTSNVKFPAQYKHLLGCVGDVEITRTGEFLRDQKTPQGESIFTVLTRMGRQITYNSQSTSAVLSQDDLKYLVHQFTAQDDTGLSYRLLDAVPLFVGPQADYKDSLIVGSLLKIVQQAFRTGEAHIHALALLGAKILKDAQAPEFLADLHQIKDHIPIDETLSVLPQALDPHHELENRVRVIECWAQEEFHLNDSQFEDYVQRRMVEIYEEPLTSVTSWKFEQYKSGALRRDGTRMSYFKPASEWKFEDLKTLLDPIFSKAADPTQSRSVVPSRPNDDLWVLNGQINFLKSFNGRVDRDFPLPIRRAHPKTSRDLLTWIDERSRDYKLINYYYENYKYPRVRRVNTLTRLDLVLLATDVLDPQTGKNFSIDFLNEIAEAWGDEKPQHWPIEIREKVNHQPGYTPKTLKQAVNNIYFREDVTENLDNLTFLAIGVPERPSCVVAAVKKINPQWDPDSFYTNTQALGNVFPAVARKIPTFPPYNRPEITKEHFQVMQRKIYNLTQTRPVLADLLKPADRRELLQQVEDARMSGIFAPSGALAFGRTILKSLKVGTHEYIDVESFFNSSSRWLSSIRKKLWHSAQSGPDSDVNAERHRAKIAVIPEVPYSGGLDTLRDLFYLVRRTTPDGRTGFIEQSEQELNNLYVILRVVKLGGLHQAGRLLAPWINQATPNAASVDETPKKLNLDEPQYRALNDFFAALVRTAAAPSALQFVKFLVGADTSGAPDFWMSDRRLIWNVLKQVFEALDQSPDARKSIRTSAFYGLAALQQIQPQSSPVDPADLMNLVATLLDQMVRDHAKWIATDPTLLKDLLTQKGIGQKIQAADQYFEGQYGSSPVAEVRSRATHFAQLALKGEELLGAVRLARSVYENREMRSAWTMLSSTLDTVQKSSEYLSLGLDRSSTQMLEFFEHRGDYTDAAAQHASNQLRYYLAAQLEAGQFEDLLRVAQVQPQGLYEVFVTWSHSVKNGAESRLKDFMRMIREGLLEPAY